MNRMPQPGEIYQHFKGNLYRIVTLAQHTETGEEMVVYQALYGAFQIYVRPLAMFIGEVDHDKYPEVSAKYRFTLIPAVGAVQVSASQTSIRQEVDAAAPDVDEKVMKDISAEKEAGSSERESIAAVQEEKSDQREEDFQLDPGLLAFLEADTYEEKLEVFVSLYGKVDEAMLNTMAVSLDLELSGDSLDEQYEILKNCLLTLERYECNRLR